MSAHDEDFINKSLLASLDAQADAEPNNYRPSFRARPFYQQETYYTQYDYLPTQYPSQFPVPVPVQLSSQTPYGPHVPGPPTAQPITSAPPPSTNAGEEISTIFVVGFPEDMSEREFQNMFTFSPGFEAATLKIPNKEYTAYNGLLPSSSSQRLYPADPYNVNQVGDGSAMPSWPAAQHDDLGHHYTVPLTGLAPPIPNPALATSSSNTLNLPQRKQIIGFAKFRTRDEALVARDVLQGRRVDIEKGAVLKAEMAKKNLHTKRGVGPVPGSLAPQPPPPPPGGTSNQGVQQQQHDGNPFGAGTDFPSSSATSSSAAQQRSSIAALSALGWRDSVSMPLSVGSSFAQQQMAEPSASNSFSTAIPTTSPAAEDTKRDSTSLLSLTSGLSLAPNNNTTTAASGGVSPSAPSPSFAPSAHQLHLPLLSGRGPRERAADDDEQQRRRRDEKEKNLMKLRAMDSAAYDAFHGVINPGSGSPAASNFSASAGSSTGSVIGPTPIATGMSRQSSSSTSLSVSAPLSASTSNSPWTGSMPTTVLSSENGTKLDHEGVEEELESPAEGNRRREEEDGYETLERRDFRDQEQDEEHLSLKNNNVNATNTTTTKEIIGPWDRINAAGGYAAVARASVPMAASGRTRAGSERSSSPPPSQPSSSFPMGSGLGMNEFSSHLGLQQQQQYANQYGYHQTPQPLQSQSPQVQNQNYQNQYQHLHMHQQQMLQQQQQQREQQRERDAYLHQYQQAQQQQYRSTQSESGDSSADPSLSTNPVGYVGAGASRLGMLNTHANGNGMSADANANGNGSGFPPPPTSSSSASSSSMTMSRHQSAFAAANGVGIVGGGGPSGMVSAPSSSSTSSSSNNGGNASPQLPSPASGGSSGESNSTTSLASGLSMGGGGGAAGLRGTVDQNPPINTLYVGNLPTSPPPIGYPVDYLEEILREAFSSRPGYRKLCFRHKANGPMCFVEFEDVHYAAKALSEMSGNTLRGIVKNGIRLSYSKNPLGVRTPTSAGGSAGGGGPTLQQHQQLMQTLSNHPHAQYQQQQHGSPSIVHHQQQQYAQHPQPPPPSSASSNGQDTFHQHMRLADDFDGHTHHPSHHQPSHHHQQQHRVQLPTSILRRDSALSPTFSSSLSQAQAFGANNTHANANANNNNGSTTNGASGSALQNGFFSSPPPRFYATSPPGPSSSSTQLTGTSSAFVPRSAAAAMANGVFGVGAGYSTAFSPFGVPFAAAGGASTGGGESGFGGGGHPQPQHSIPGEQQQKHSDD